MEIILLVFGMVVIISVVQAVRRGDVDRETRENNSTIMEQLAQNTEILSERTTAWARNSKFIIEHCGWFKDFERHIEYAMRYSHLKADLQLKKADLQLKLDNHPDLKRIWEQQQATAENSIFHEREEKTSASWFSSGPPPVPGDSKNSEYFSIEYKRYLDNHISFVEATRKALNEDPRMKEIFVNFFEDGEDKQRLMSHLFSAGTDNSSNCV